MKNEGFRLEEATGASQRVIVTKSFDRLKLNSNDCLDFICSD